MQLDFELLSMTELRTHPGEILDRVADSGQAFIIERKGHRRACLVPVSVFLPDIHPARIAREYKELLAHGNDLRTTITENRELALRFRHSASDQTEVELVIVLPHGYPNRCPRVYAEPLAEGTPHRWQDGALCIFGVMSTWNPGKHTVLSTLALAHSWLEHYQSWCKTSQWPNEGLPDEE